METFTLQVYLLQCVLAFFGGTVILIVPHHRFLLYLLFEYIFKISIYSVHKQFQGDKH